MRIYAASDEETLRARGLLRDWRGEGLLTEAQYLRMEQETVCDLRRTNIFLRLVLFFFALIIVGSAAGLFFTVFFSNPSSAVVGTCLLILAAVTYAAAEFAASGTRFYRYGIEEGLGVCAVGFFCAGLWSTIVSGHPYSPPPNIGIVPPAASALFSLWIWHRFGLWYAFPAAMIFAAFLPVDWTSSHAAQHMIVAALYSAGLIAVAAVRPRHRFDYLDREYSLAEAFLWLGIYLAVNLQLSSLTLLGGWWGFARANAEFPQSFYWTTFVLIWCLPPAMLARGVRQNDRLVIAAGAIAALLTLITNKPYLGWQRHTWDPMLLGALLVGVALVLRRWLASGPDGIRRGFTAARISGKDEKWMNAGITAFGLASPQSLAPSPQPASPDVHFGGGDSGGGGATSDF